MEVDISLHRSLNNALIIKGNTIKETMDMTFLGNMEAIREVQETSIPRK
jgi:hypothetical protein